MSSYEPVKKQKVAENKFQDARMHENARYQNETHSARIAEPKYSNEPPAYLPYSPSPIITHNERNPVHTPEQTQNLTMEQKMQYFYYLNNPSTYYPYGN